MRLPARHDDALVAWHGARDTGTLSGRVSLSRSPLPIARRIQDRRIAETPMTRAVLDNSPYRDSLDHSCRRFAVIAVAVGMR